MDVFDDLFVFSGSEVVNDEEIVDYGDEKGGEEEIYIPAHVTPGEFLGGDMGKSCFEGEKVLFQGRHFKIKRMKVGLGYYEAVLMSKTMALYRMVLFACYWVYLYAVMARYCVWGTPIVSYGVDYWMSLVVIWCVMSTVEDVVDGTRGAKECQETDWWLGWTYPGVGWLAREFEGILVEEYIEKEKGILI